MYSGKDMNKNHSHNDDLKGELDNVADDHDDHLKLMVIGLSKEFLNELTEELNEIIKKEVIGLSEEFLNELTEGLNEIIKKQPAAHFTIRFYGDPVESRSTAPSEYEFKLAFRKVCASIQQNPDMQSFLQKKIESEIEGFSGSVKKLAENILRSLFAAF